MRVSSQNVRSAPSTLFDISASRSRHSSTSHTGCLTVGPHSDLLNQSCVLPLMVMGWRAHVGMVLAHVLRVTAWPATTVRLRFRSPKVTHRCVWLWVRCAACVKEQSTRQVPGRSCLVTQLPTAWLTAVWLATAVPLVTQGSRLRKRRNASGSYLPKRDPSGMRRSAWALRVLSSEILPQAVRHVLPSRRSSFSRHSLHFETPTRPRSATD